MKIVEHTESHLVKLDDDSTWQIFPGDIRPHTCMVADDRAAAVRDRR
jgi:hypothetical protein